MTSRLAFAAFALCGALGAADSPVSQAAAKLDLQAAKAPAPLALDLRLRGAQTLQVRYPELSRKFLDATLKDLRGSRDWTPGPSALQSLAELSPTDAVALVPKLGPGAAQTMIFALVRVNHVDEALALYRSARARGDVPVSAVTPLLGALVKEKPAVAATLFTDAAASFADPLSPSDAWWLVNISVAVANALPDAVAEGYERVLRAALPPDYGRDAKTTMTGTFQIGSTSITTDNSRDTLLLVAGARLRVLAPQRFAKFKEAVAKWEINGPLSIRGMSFGTGNAPPRPPEVMAISKRMGTMRGLPTDADRSVLTKELVRDIRALPDSSNRLGLIRSLASVATEGDLGKEALEGVASTLADALREASKQPASNVDSYIELAKLVRYEHLAVPSDPSLEAAQAFLELLEQVQQENGFTLTSLDGKTYTLAGLKGKIVLLNFWATWCPPCRKEMPDMEKLYTKYEAKGLTVIAVSDEDRETVTKFLAKNNYSFPIALDPDRKVNTAFAVEGIPKSFIFDREGRLAAQAIDMRTEGQFMELLKIAGLNEPRP